MADYNGDLRLVAHQLSEMNGKIDKLDGKVEENIKVNNDRLREGEKQSALQELSLKTISEKVESLDSDVKRISFVSKVMSGVADGLAVIAVAIGISK